AELDAVAKEVGSTQAAVALRWVAQRPGISSVIIGARTLEQFESNIAAATLRLSDTHMERLTKVSDTPLPYPHDRIAASTG
ncbi:aldo/keto reductase, partial [Salmonella enterica]|uniref:aldo/keto reductase n=1 Tax=Salmonella enterica TaxID=28901 RepID=UPI003CF1D24A